MYSSKKNTEYPKNKEMEIELKSPYTKLCGTENDNNSGSNSSRSDDSDSEDLKVSDGFAGGFQLSHTTNQTPV